MIHTITIIGYLIYLIYLFNNNNAIIPWKIICTNVANNSKGIGLGPPPIPAIDIIKFGTIVEIDIIDILHNI